MKSKVFSLIMFVIASLSIAFGYKQHLEATAQRDEVIKLHRQIKELTLESEAARLEAARLRALVEQQQKNAEAQLQEMQKKK